MESTWLISFQHNQSTFIKSINIKLFFCRIAKERSKEIDKIIKKEKEELEMSGWKVLLLGPASSGKSTLLRQMRLIHSGGFTEIERDIFKALIYTSIVQNMTNLVKGVVKLGLSTSEDTKYNVNKRRIIFLL